METVEYKVDFCVVGGGMAGVCAAIAAARHGVRVALIQERPMLGGNASSENRMWICGARGKNNRETGIIEEIMLENLYRNPTKNFYIFDSILLDFARREKNLTLFLNTTCMDAEVESGEFDYGRTKRIVSVKGYQMTTQRFINVRADYFADCSGDSILAPLSGAEFRYGRESADEFGEDTSVKTRDGMVMGMSCLIQGRETGREVRFTPSEFATKLSEEDVKNRPMNIYDTKENFWYLELGGFDGGIGKTEETKEKLIDLALGAWDHIKNSGNYNAENWELEFLGMLPAKRESRRMLGEYVISQRDISNGVIFNDTVAFGGWPLDDHFPAGYYHKGTPNTYIRTPAPYPIPYRALYSRNVDNLFFAGRNISMTHMAMSSMRVMATCSILGEAVGCAAAVAAKYGIPPHGVYLDRIGELQDVLMCADCFLPYFKRRISESCLTAEIVGADGSIRSGEDRANTVYGTENKGVAVKCGDSIGYKLGAYERINSVHIVFDSDLDRETLPGDGCERTHVTRANVLLNSPVMHMPTTLVRSFSLKALTENGEITLLSVDNNLKRSYHVEIPEGITISELTLAVLRGWGEKEARLISFDFN